MDRDTSQTGMNRCAGDEAARAESDLNAVYQQMLKTANGNQRAIQRIRAAERAWIAYRDAYIEAMFPEEDKQAAYGTIYPMSVSVIRAHLTRTHISELRDWITQYDDYQ